VKDAGHTHFAATQSPPLRHDGTQTVFTWPETFKTTFSTNITLLNYILYHAKFPPVTFKSVKNSIHSKTLSILKTKLLR